MLRNQYILSDLPSENAAPNIPVTEKLNLINTAPVLLVPASDNENEFDLQLPFIRDAAFTYGLPSMVGSIVLDRINIGDKELYGHGIGSRLVRAACRFAVEQDTRINTFLVDEHPRIGVLNTVIRVFGERQVEARIGSALYGRGHDRTLEQLFDDFPVQVGQPYLLSSITASIDFDTAMNWEPPIR